MTSDLFRREVIEARRHAWLGRVQVLQPLSFRLVACATVALGLAAVLYASFGVYTRRVHATGYMASPSGLITVAVMKGAMSVGMLVAFLSYKDQFAGRIGSLINSAFQIRMLSVQTEGLSDIVMPPTEPSEPTRQITLDGENIDALTLEGYRSRIAGVLQDDGLFSSSITDNISGFTEELVQEWLRECAARSTILHDIERMPMGFDTLIGDMGTGQAARNNASFRHVRCIANPISCFWTKPRVIWTK